MTRTGNRIPRFPALVLLAASLAACGDSPVAPGGRVTPPAEASRDYTSTSAQRTVGGVSVSGYLFVESACDPPAGWWGTGFSWSTYIAETSTTTAVDYLGVKVWPTHAGSSHSPVEDHQYNTTSASVNFELNSYGISRESWASAAHYVQVGSYSDQFSTFASEYNEVCDE